MASPDESSTLELISQYLLTDFNSIDNFITNLNFCTSTENSHLENRPQTQNPNLQKSSSTLSQRKPAINVTIPQASTLKIGNSDSMESELLQANCGKKRKNEEPEISTVERKVVKKEEVTETETVTETVTTSAGVGVGPLTPSSWTGFWDDGNGKGIFSVPPLSPLSPLPCMGYSRLTVM
ncbi:hypothetical protein JRO89_XS11G0123500 [Xanthoceras sorbifolium]|uniref:Uncharacterized protein n=1 Tax=Xanthoceras sorbifolium TaxID=99658 RepID=A0ABQ8HFF2_9ROSI|nr:hypothetical protein JRO89_XS11G0123500 [Xanthoceras sorbifolium]